MKLRIVIIKCACYTFWQLLIWRLFSFILLFSKSDIFQPTSSNRHLPTDIFQPTSSNRHLPTGIFQPTSSNRHLPTDIFQPTSSNRHLPTDIFQPTSSNRHLPTDIFNRINIIVVPAQVGGSAA